MEKLLGKYKHIKMLLMQLTEEHDLEVLWLLYLLLETQDSIEVKKSELESM